MLIEEHAVLQSHRIEVFAADVVVTARRGGVTFQLADDSTRMDMIHAGKPHPLGDDAERYAVRLLPRVGASDRPGADAGSCRCARAHLAMDWIAV